MVIGPVTEELVFRAGMVPLHVLAGRSFGSIVWTTPLFFGIGMEIFLKYMWGKLFADYPLAWQPTFTISTSSTSAILPASPWVYLEPSSSSSIRLCSGGLPYLSSSAQDVCGM